MKMTQYEIDAMGNLVQHATETQTICKGLGELMTGAQLRAHIAGANRAYDLRPAILEEIARRIEYTVGIKMGLENA